MYRVTWYWNNFETVYETFVVDNLDDIPKELVRQIRYMDHIIIEDEFSYHIGIDSIEKISEDYNSKCKSYLKETAKIYYQKREEDRKKLEDQKIRLEKQELERLKNKYEK